ncbi:electron transfer flavoprotein subunit alpha/FixB family protein [Thermodesulfobacteriota bacterium]
MKKKLRKYSKNWWTLVYFKEEDELMENRNGPVWVVAEQLDCRVRTVSLQLMGQAKRLASQIGSNAEAVLFGNRMEEHVRPLFAAGADRVFLGNDPQLAYYEPELYVEAIVRLAREHGPEIILLGSTAMGRELAPLVAARLNTGLTAHCIELVLNENNILEQRIPAYGGLLSIICPEKRPQMATIAKGVFPLPELDDTLSGEIVPVAVPENVPRRIQTLDVVHQVPEEIPLESARVVVAGGAGAGDHDGWQQIADLAEILNAALGCTRPVVDEGWAPLELMIGQSGRMVSPELYIGIGLSGEQQHVVGVTGAKVMIAVNNDAKSPVFEQVDYGVVDDCREFVPLLIKKIKEHREHRVQCSS